MPHVDYKINGVKWPSVTEVLSVPEKDWKWHWYRGAVKKHGWRGWQKCDAMGTRGKEFGTDFHRLLFNRLAPEVGLMQDNSAFVAAPRFRSHIENLVKATYAYIIKARAKPFSLETHLVSHEFEYHGTTDALMDVGGTLEVWDWKTNNKSDLFHAVQLAAYAHAWNEQNPGRPIDTGRIIRVDKKAKTPKVLESRYTGLRNYFSIFVACREVLDFTKQTGKWQQEGDGECQTLS